MASKRDKIRKMIESGQSNKASRLLDKEPPSGWKLCTEAHILSLAGRADEAFQKLQLSVNQFPGEVRGYKDLASLLARGNRLQDAVKVFEACVNALPDSPEGYRGIGECLVLSGDLRRAAEFYLHAWGLERKNHQLAGETAKLLMELGDAVRALAPAEAAARAKPGISEYLFTLGRVYFAVDRPFDAMQAFQGVTKGELAVPAKARVVACLTALNRPAEADALIDEMLAGGAPLTSELIGSKAELAQIQGDMASAVALARQALEQTKAIPGAWRILLTAGELTEPDIAELEALWQTSTSEVKMELGFYLAEVCEKRGDLDRQIELLRLSNDAKSEMVTYRPQGQADYFASIRQHARDNADVALNPAAPAPTEGLKPLLVVGMPRSGTTLTEQILSSHSRVEAAGESYAFKYAAEKVAAELELGGYQALWGTPMADYSPQLGRYYREYMAEEGITSACVTDKSITLYRYLGPILAAMPDTAIVVMHRHPLDLALGQYKQLFATGQYFTYRPEWMAHALVEFYRMIRFWQDWGVPMMHLRYEDLVRDQEACSRRLLDNAGLEWEEGVLAFERNRRAVATASVAQVRKGLYQSAAGRWQRYGSLLDGFAEAYAEAGLEISAYDADPLTMLRASKAL